jgi:hypothetical protein
VVVLDGSGLTEWLTGGSARHVAVGQTPVRSATADFNRDGRDDVAVTEVGGAVAVLLGSATGLAPAGSVTVAGSPYDIAAGDADGDGDPDVVTTEFTLPDPTVTLLTNDGTGAFAKTRWTAAARRARARP